MNQIRLTKRNWKAPTRNELMPTSNNKVRHRRRQRLRRRYSSFVLLHWDDLWPLSCRYVVEIVSFLLALSPSLLLFWVPSNASMNTHIPIFVTIRATSTLIQSSRLVHAHVHPALNPALNPASIVDVIVEFKSIIKADWLTVSGL